MISFASAGEVVALLFAASGRTWSVEEAIITRGHDIHYAITVRASRMQIIRVHRCLRRRPLELGSLGFQGPWDPGVPGL